MLRCLMYHRRPLSALMGHAAQPGANQGFKYRRPDPDHRPEPAGAFRPAGLAGVPGARLGRLRRRGVCPKGQGDPSYQVIDGVELYKYRPYAPVAARLSFVVEYAYSFLATAWLTLKARRGGRFAVIQACNPPDIFWPIALVLPRAGWHQVRLRPPRPVPRAVRVPLPRRPDAAVPGPARPRAPHAPDRGSRDLHQRLLPRDRHRPQRQVARSDVTVVRTGPDPDKLQARPGRPGPAARPQVPGRLHRRDGPAGRGRHRGPGGRHRGPRAGPRTTSPSR